MLSSKADIITRLQREILPLQGYKPISKTTQNLAIGRIKYAFPDNSFPLSAIHEFITTTPEQTSATTAFIAALTATLMRNNGPAIYISSTRNIFPIATQAFGIKPEQLIFIDLKKDKDIPWAMEEALKCTGISAVIAELPELSFTASRRLQLAVEQSRVTGFVIRKYPKHSNTTACVTRWRINPLPSETEEGLPGVGHPRWNVELLKVRNGKPGSWQLEWNAESFKYIEPITFMPMEQPWQQRG